MFSTGKSFYQLLVIYFFLTSWQSLCAQSSMWRCMPVMAYSSKPVREENFLWFTVTDGIIKYDLNSNTYEFIDVLKTPAEQGVFYGLDIDSIGRKWILTDYEILVYDNFNWSKKRPDPSYIGRNIHALPDGEVWVEGGGYLHYDGNTWNNIFVINGVSLSYTGEFDAQQDGDTMYVMNYYNQCVKFYNNGAEIIPLDPDFNLNYVKNSLLYGTDSLQRYTFGIASGLTEIQYTCPDSVFAQNIPVTVFGVDDSGNVYLSPVDLILASQLYLKYSAAGNWQVINIPADGKKKWIYLDKKNEVTINVLNNDTNSSYFTGENIWHQNQNGQWQNINFNDPCKNIFSSLAAGVDRIGNLRQLLNDYTEIVKSDMDSCGTGVNQNTCPVLNATGHRSSIVLSSGAVSNAYFDSLNNAWTIGRIYSNGTYYELLINYTACDTMHLGNGGNYYYMGDDNRGWLYFRAALDSVTVKIFTVNGSDYREVPFALNAITEFSPHMVIVRDSIFYFINAGNNRLILNKVENGISSLVDFGSIGYPSFDALFLDIDSDNNVWVAGRSSHTAADGILMKFDGNMWSASTLPFGAPMLFSVFGREIWYGSLRFLAQLNSTGWHTFPMPHSEFYQPYLWGKFYKRTDGKFWADLTPSGYINSIVQFDPNGTYDCYTNNSYTGGVFIDVDSNGIWDMGEQGVPGQFITAGDNLAVTNDDGTYTIDARSTDTTIYLQARGIYPLVTDTHHISINGQHNNLNFPCRFIPGAYDAAVTVTSAGIRPGELVQYFLHYGNIGNTTIPSATVTLTFDSAALNFGGFLWGNGVVSGNTITFQSSALRYNDFIYDYIYFTPRSTDTIGQPIIVSATIYPMDSIDLDHSNNSSIWVDSILSSFDPNNKRVQPGGNIDSVTTLTYTIQFQNTGNAPARKVILVDTLDDNLDLTTLKVLNYSHPVTYSIYHRILTFSFLNINLPDSNSNIDSSHGFVTYSIRPKANIQPGSRILNTADIYFDYNLPIKTNKVITGYKIPTALNSETLERFSVSAYPNPFKNETKIIARNIDYYDFSLFDAVGVQVLYRANVYRYLNLNCTQLPAGIYFYQIRSKSGIIGNGKLILTH